MTFTIDSTSWRSPNHSARPAGADIWALIIHSCEGSPPGNEEQSSLPWLCNPSSQVSSHYYITRAGLIYQLVDDARQAWHAGESVLNGVWYCNGYSIGVELEHHDNAAPYPAAQMQALTWLAQHKIAEYAIPQYGVATHRQVAMPLGRKSDPTDWSDADFAAWASALYPSDPLRACTIPGPPGTTYFCSAPTADFYSKKGGFGLFGYPTGNEVHAAFGQNKTPCTIFPLQRTGPIKRSDTYGVELALLTEAATEGWI